MSEAAAVKTEIVEAMKRRFVGDTRDQSELFGIMSVALSEVMADMIFAAAKNEEHGRNLLAICQMYIDRRWRDLAIPQIAEPAPLNQNE